VTESGASRCQGRAETYIGEVRDFAGWRVSPLFMEGWQSPVYCSGPENRQACGPREFKSHPFRQQQEKGLKMLKTLMERAAVTAANVNASSTEVQQRAISNGYAYGAVPDAVGSPPLLASFYDALGVAQNRISGLRSRLNQSIETDDATISRAWGDRLGRTECLDERLNLPEPAGRFGQIDVALDKLALEIDLLDAALFDLDARCLYLARIA
jgi:hypothetical protein